MTLGALLIAKSNAVELLAFSFLQKKEVDLARFYKNASKGFSERLNGMFLSDAKKELSEPKIRELREKLSDEVYMQEAVADAAEKIIDEEMR
jgi:hypothetical protein